MTQSAARSHPALLSPTAIRVQGAITANNPPGMRTLAEDGQDFLAAAMLSRLGLTSGRILNSPIVRKTAKASAIISIEDTTKTIVV